MGLLPCIRRGSDRWWLPCSGTATESIGQLMLASARAWPVAMAEPHSTTRPRWLHEATRAQLQRVMESDPPLWIFAALNWGGDSFETGQLVDWLAEHVTGRFASGDAFLGAPAITSAMESRWDKLRDHFRVLPLERWLDDAPLWLEVTGPKVSRPWQQQWPRLAQDMNSPSDHDAADLWQADMLQQLARLTQRQRSLEHAFDRRLHKSKLAAIKELAYGLSHEINNPLANISTRAQQLQRGEQDASRIATLQRIIDQVYRAHEMIADLMFYANPPLPQLAACDLAAVVRTVANSFVEETERQHIRLEIPPPAEPTMVQVDAEMIGEAVRVLIRNAIDAVGCQGTIVVSLARNGQSIKIHVADSGPGLSEKSRQHAFDPYFSGREAGRGLGLGLCRAYRIARLHHADISLAGGPAGCVATIALRA